MPPSGFSNSSMQGLKQFLNGCFNDLRAEVDSGKHASLKSGLEYEVKQIKSAINQTDRDDIRASLMIVGRVYQDALSLSVNIAEDKAIEQAISTCVERIGRLHITQGGQLTER